MFSYFFFAISSFFVSVVFLFLLFALIVSFFANLIEGFLRVHSFCCFCPIVVPIISQFSRGFLQCHSFLFLSYRCSYFFSFFEAFLFVPSFLFIFVCQSRCASIVEPYSNRPFFKSNYYILIWNLSTCPKSPSCFHSNHSVKHLNRQLFWAACLPIKTPKTET